MNHFTSFIPFTNKSKHSRSRAQEPTASREIRESELPGPSNMETRFRLNSSPVEQNDLNNSFHLTPDIDEDYEDVPQSSGYYRECVRPADNTPMNTTILCRDLSSITLPQFFSSEPTLFFAAAENLFNIYGVHSEKDRFTLLMRSLDLHHLQSVEQCLARLNSDLPYSHLKSALLQNYQPSESTRLDKLLYFTQLGDKKPSNLLFEMQKLLGNEVAIHNKPLLKKLFLDKLPTEVRMILAATNHCSLTELARKADKILETQPVSVSTVIKPSTAQENTQYEQIKLLANQIETLTTEVKDLKDISSKSENNTNNRFQSRNFQRSPRTNHEEHFTETARFRGRFQDHRYPRTTHSFSQNLKAPIPPTTPRMRGEVCFYHHKFGPRALKCIAPCTWQNNSKGGFSKNA